VENGIFDIKGSQPKWKKYKEKITLRALELSGPLVNMLEDLV
jgi:hypothetical protein